MLRHPRGQLEIGEGLQDAVVPCQRGRRIAVQGRADLGRDGGEGDALGMENAVAILEMVHGARRGACPGSRHGDGRGHAEKKRKRSAASLGRPPAGRSQFNRGSKKKLFFLAFGLRLISRGRDREVARRRDAGRALEGLGSRQPRLGGRRPGSASEPIGTAPPLGETGRFLRPQPAIERLAATRSRSHVPRIVVKSLRPPAITAPPS